MNLSTLIFLIFTVVFTVAFAFLLHSHKRTIEYSIKATESNNRLSESNERLAKAVNHLSEILEKNKSK